MQYNWNGITPPRLATGRECKLEPRQKKQGTKVLTTVIFPRLVAGGGEAVAWSLTSCIRTSRRRLHAWAHHAGADIAG